MNPRILSGLAAVFLVLFSSAALAQDVYDNGMPRSLSCEEAYRSIQAHDAELTVEVVEYSEEGSEPDEGVAKTTLTYDIYNRQVFSLTEFRDGSSVEGRYEYFGGADGCSNYHPLRSETWTFRQGGEIAGTRRASFDREGTIVDQTDEGEDFPVPLIDVQDPEPTRECEKTSLLIERRDEPFTVVDDDSRSELRITYDEYERPVFIENKLPLGYYAETSYEYFNNAYLYEERSRPGQCNYKERVSSESGRMLRGESAVASYRISYDEDGTIVETASEGGSFVRWLIVDVLAPLLGYDAADPEGQEWLDERFGKEQNGSESPQ